MRASRAGRRSRGGPGFVVRGHHSRPTEAAPELADGKVRCPVCRNGVTPTVTGYLRQHRDLFGLTCYNRRPPEAS